MLNGSSKIKALTVKSVVLDVGTHEKRVRQKNNFKNTRILSMKPT